MITEAHLAGKIAIVTGSSRGIGAGIALELAKKGANVRSLALRLGSNTGPTSYANVIR